MILSTLSYRVKIIRPTPTFSFSKRRRKATADLVYQGNGVSENRELH